MLLPPFFPLFTDIADKKVLIAGGGGVALRRAATLKTCGAIVHIVSPEFCRDIKSRGYILVQKKWEPADLEGAVLAVAATDDREENRRFGLEAKRRGIPVSVADSAQECTFFFPSLITKDGASASISTRALSPELTRRLADRLRDVWPRWVDEERGQIKKKRESEI